MVYLDWSPETAGNDVDMPLPPPVDAEPAPPEAVPLPPAAELAPAPEEDDPEDEELLAAELPELAAELLDVELDELEPEPLVLEELQPVITSAAAVRAVIAVRRPRLKATLPLLVMRRALPALALNEYSIAASLFRDRLLKYEMGFGDVNGPIGWPSRRSPAMGR